MRSARYNYEDNAAAAIAPRDVEAAAFVFVNRHLEDAGDPRSRIEALGRNQKLWSLLLKDLALSSNALPPILKNDLVQLASFSMRYSIEAMSGALPLEPLLSVNRDMIAALRAAVVSEAPAPPSHVVRLGVAATA